ncbi:DNA polymerase I [Rhodoplanes sp. Z2-YC6860]|uniref:DNA polymerase I n=1 Tax=Rhodoplanes sp. Z2-YC6860 TaxID=674703 RepID=UPI00078C6427|nr:DNA polymerase I [Rhodoplanes sp. Z2-YC6860]AMN45149.1 DNA polymerase I [Rhodoplanes sp. Z2-YC6860]
MPSPSKSKSSAEKPDAKKPAPAKAAPAKGAATGLKKGDHVFLVDGSGYIFRAYHALPPLTRKSDGLQINAVLGFCNMLWKLLNDMKPDEKPSHLAVVFDKSEKTFRTELYPQYKAHRPDIPEDLIPQFPLIRDAVKAFDIPCLEQAGFEADDIIATYARQACEAKATCTIVSSDKDLMQLVNDCVVMYDTMKDKRIGIPEVIEKFGVPPEKVIEAQALIGDSTDNVPGVPGIGPKTAAQLLEEFGDLETLLKRAGEIKQEKRRQTLIDNAELARISKKLVTLDQHVPLEVPVEDLAVHEPEYKNLIAFLKAMEFNTLTRRVAEKSGIEASEIEASSSLSSGKAAAPAAKAKPVSTSVYGEFDLGDRPARTSAPSEDKAFSPVELAAAHLAAEQGKKFDRSKYETVRSLDRLKAWVLRAKDVGLVAISTRTTSPDPMTAQLCGISLALADNEACYVPLGHRDGGKAGGGDLFAPEAKLLPDQISEDAALKEIRALLEDPGVLKIGQNLKYDWQIFARRGIEIFPYDDTMLVSYVLDAGKGSHSLDDLAERWLDHQAIPLEQVTGTGKNQLRFDSVPIDKASEHGAEQADVTLRLWKALKARMAADRVATVYETLERPLISVLARMEGRGISIDRQVLSRLSGEFAQKQGGLEDEINKLAGGALNPGSPKQLGDVLFGQMGLPGGTKTKTGQWATGAKVLEELAEQGHDLPRKILDWRQVSKLRSTYTDSLPDYVNAETHRVHTFYALAATPTGRLSSSEPNLQNIPVRTEEGRKIRRAFIAEPGTKLISADYSQIELRLLAEIGDVPLLKQAFRDGLDIHAMTASEMFGVPIKGMPGEVRRRAKAINFGIIYGISAFGLANQLGIGRDEAGAYIKKYFERFPGIRDYMEETKASAKRDGYVLTIFGRKCHYPEIKAANAALRAFNERAAINARLQGSAADIIRRAMIRIEPALSKAKLNAKMLLQVHDELIFEAPEGEIEKTLPVIKRVMEEAPMPAVSLQVPLQVDARAAHNWDEAH